MVIFHGYVNLPEGLIFTGHIPLILASLTWLNRRRGPRCRRRAAVRSAVMSSCAAVNGVEFVG